jgi:hypothetical protein
VRLGGGVISLFFVSFWTRRGGGESWEINTFTAVQEPEDYNGPVLAVYLSCAPDGATSYFLRGIKTIYHRQHISPSYSFDFKTPSVIPPSFLEASQKKKKRVQKRNRKTYAAP